MTNTAPAAPIEKPTIQHELEIDLYNLTTLVTPRSRWYDAGFNAGDITRRIIELGGHPIGAADTDPLARDFIHTVDPTPVIHERFDPIAMIADCPRLDAVKIDIQGGELVLLTIEEHAWNWMPNAITMEWHTEHLPLGSYHLIIEQLTAVGYTVQRTRPWRDALDGSATDIITATRHQ